MELSARHKRTINIQKPSCNSLLQSKLIPARAKPSPKEQLGKHVPHTANVQIQAGVNALGIGTPIPPAPKWDPFNCWRHFLLWFEGGWWNEGPEHGAVVAFQRPWGHPLSPAVTVEGTKLLQVPPPESWHTTRDLKSTSPGSVCLNPPFTQVVPAVGMHLMFPGSGKQDPVLLTLQLMLSKAKHNMCWPLR